MAAASKPSSHTISSLARNVAAVDSDADADEDDGDEGHKCC